MKSRLDNLIRINLKVHMTMVNFKKILEFSLMDIIVLCMIMVKDNIP